MLKKILVYFALIGGNIISANCLTLQVKSKWAPGVACWTDATGTQYEDYVMFMCDCYRDGMWRMKTDIQTAVENPDCGSVRTGTTVSGCGVGITTQCVGFGWGASVCEKTSRVGYMCAPKTAKVADVCKCVANDSTTYDATLARYTHKGYPALYNIPWIIGNRGEGLSDVYGLQYACTIDSSSTTTYSCFTGYYLSGESCKECPEFTDINGEVMIGISKDQNSGGITDCYLPAGAGPFEDQTGIFEYADKCYYSK